jgi:hypothetical protein
MQSSPLEDESEEQTIGDTTVECLQGDLCLAREIIRECNARGHRRKGKDLCGICLLAAIKEGYA